MKAQLSQEEIGRRVTELRKLKGFSQEELSKLIHLSRSSLAQIELGNRNLDVLELQQLAKVLQFSLDEFMAENFILSKKIKSDEQVVEVKFEERIAVPRLHKQKFKNVLLYILERCAGKPNVGETVLYKLLYFSDFNYYEIYEEHLTGAKYKKLPFGPVPQQLDLLIRQMEVDGELQRIKTMYHDYPQTRFLPNKKADLSKLLASEKEVIDRVIEQMSDWTATSISNYSHKDLPWEVTEDGKFIDYELVFYREAPYSVRSYDEQNEEK